MILFRKKPQIIVVNAKFKLNDFVDFYYRDDIYFGTISKIYLDDDNRIIYDIDIAGQCPATLQEIKEEKVIRIHKK